MTDNSKNSAITQEDLFKIVSEKQKEAKELQSSFSASLQAGKLVDVQDKVNVWRAARIVQRNEKKAEVSFEGWSAKWNEIKLIGGPQIAPFRSENHKYSGSLKKKILDEYKIEEVILELSALNEKILQRADFIENATCDEINYGLRGDLFMTVHNTLIISANIRDIAALKADSYYSIIESAFYCLINLSLQYIETIQPLIPLYCLGKAKDKYLYLVERSSALVDSFIDIGYMVEAIFGGADYARHLYKVTNPCVYS